MIHLKQYPEHFHVPEKGTPKVTGYNYYASLMLKQTTEIVHLSFNLEIKKIRISKAYVMVDVAEALWHKS